MQLLGAAPALAAPAGQSVHELYERAVVIDALGNPQSFNVPWPPQYQPLNEEQLASARECGITALNVTVNDTAFEDTVSHIAFLMSETERNPKLFYSRKSLLGQGACFHGIPAANLAARSIAHAG